MTENWLYDNWKFVMTLVLIGIAWGRLETRMNHVELDVERIWRAVMPDSAANKPLDIVGILEFPSDNSLDISGRASQFEDCSLGSASWIKSPWAGDDVAVSDGTISNHAGAKGSQHRERRRVAIRLPCVSYVPASDAGFP